MIVIMRDAVMPECCKTCVCSEGYGCGITGTIMTTKEMESRPDWCPLEEVEPCEDAVSREKAFSYFVTLWECIGTIMDRDEWEDVCRTTANELPPVTPKEQRWIPVSKELPDDLDKVNITWINNDPEPYYAFVKGKAFTGSAVFYQGDWYWYSSVTVDVLAEYGRCDAEKMDKGIKVIAWMPLPEPFQGEGEAK